jgi:hypothetical protein
MKLTQKIVALTGIVAFAATPLFAGTGKTFKETVVVEEEATPWYNASLSTGFDSLYMYRGLNVLGATTNTDWNTYGNSLYWTSLAFTWNITENDSLTIGSWMGFGVGNELPTNSLTDGYKEFNGLVNYAHTMDALTFGLGYTFYYVFPNNAGYFANELNASLAYEIDLGFMTLTPSATYYFNFGPDNDTGNGAVNAASSFLSLKVVGGIPVYKDIVSLAPYSTLNFNFGYNLDENLEAFDGFNNWELGLSVPIAINDTISITPYVAYSYAFVNLWGTTMPSTFWGGGNVSFAF